jgi:anti-sigma-K factor RskA
LDDERAAEYALGVLDGKGRRGVAAALRTDGEMARLVEAWERRLAPLALAIPPQAAPATLWPAIQRDIARAALAPGVRVIRAGEGSWQTLEGGIAIKVLAIDAARGVRTVLLRFSPGGRIEPHPHLIAEECFVISGHMLVGDLELNPGDYHFARKGALHPALTSPRGGLVHVRSGYHAD